MTQSPYDASQPRVAATTDERLAQYEADIRYLYQRLKESDKMLVAAHDDACGLKANIDRLQYDATLYRCAIAQANNLIQGLQDDMRAMLTKIANRPLFNLEATDGE